MERKDCKREVPGMLKLDEILNGEYTIRSTKDREGDLDYFVDNFGKPLVIRYMIEMEFFEVATILIRIGQGDIISVHFLKDRDLMSAMSFIEVDTRRFILHYKAMEDKSYLLIRDVVWSDVLGQGDEAGPR
jgi:hypothetical protein